MKMVDRLPRTRIGVEHNPITVRSNTSLSCQPGSKQEYVSYQLLVIRFEIKARWNVLPGHDEDMNRGLGVDVLEGHKLIVLMDDRRRDFLLGDLAEEATHRNRDPAVDAGLQAPRPRERGTQAAQAPASV
jgi:hypothetical protein